jgi:hypothetical protein
MGWSSESLAVLEHCTSSLNIFLIFYFICCLSHLYTLFLCSAWLGYCRTESFSQLQSTPNTLSNVLVTYSCSFLKIWCAVLVQEWNLLFRTYGWDIAGIIQPIRCSSLLIMWKNCWLCVSVLYWFVEWLIYLTELQTTFSIYAAVGLG